MANNQRVTIKGLRRDAERYNGRKTDKMVTSCDPSLRRIFTKVATKRGMTPAHAMRIAFIDWIAANK